MIQAIPRAVSAALAASALALTLWGGISTRAAASPQATPMPTPAVTPVPSPMPTPPPIPMPAITPAGNPVPTAPSPGTDMLNSNPNGNWLEKFTRTATPDPSMRPPAMMLPSWCKPLMKPGMKLTAAQRAKLKTQCWPKKTM